MKLKSLIHALNLAAGLALLTGRQMKKSKFLLAAALGLLNLGQGLALAQTVTNTNPLITALQSTIVDTNSTFFNSATLELRALTQTSLDRYESVLSGTYYPGTNGNFGIGAEVINGSFNVLDSAYLTLEYAVPYHNVKFRPIAGFGYDLVNRGLAVEAGGALEVALSQNMFADTEALVQVPFHNYSGQNISGTFRLGIGWRF
jgi:hypothetical protein